MQRLKIEASSLFKISHIDLYISDSGVYFSDGKTSGAVQLDCQNQIIIDMIKMYVTMVRIYVFSGIIAKSHELEVT